MTVRTKTLATGSSAPLNTDFAVYTCPAGETVILKDVRVSVPAGTNTRLIVFCDSGPARVSLLDVALSATDTFGLECWVVLLPGDEIGVYSEGATFRYWLSGTELEGLAD